MDNVFVKKLNELGWIFTQEDLLKYLNEECEEEVVLNTTEDWANFLLEIDFRKIPRQNVGITLHQALQRPQILQIEKIRNVAVPKINENDDKGGSRILKIALTDGHSTCQGLEIARVNGLSMDTPPGTKIWLAGSSVAWERNFFLLTNSNCKIIGGNVEEMIEKWHANRDNRGKQRQSGAGGPPAWVPFGKSIDTSTNLTKGFESMAITRNESAPVVSEEFEQNRSAVIAQVQASGTSAKFQQANPKISIPAPVADIPTGPQAYQERQNYHQPQPRYQDNRNDNDGDYRQNYDRGGGYSSRGNRRGGRGGRGNYSRGGRGGGRGGRGYRNNNDYDY